MNRRIGKGRPVDWKDSEKFKGNICYGGLVETLRASHLVGSVLQGDAPHTLFLMNGFLRLWERTSKPGLLEQARACCWTGCCFQYAHFFFGGKEVEVIKSWCSSLPVGAGAYAFENVRTSVEHGCRHVGWQTFGELWRHRGRT